MFNVEKMKEVLSKKIKLKSKSGKIADEKAFIAQVLEDIEKNHNHSWYKELYLRNKDNLDDTALIYRGNEITYGQMFENMRTYAKALKTMGIGKDSEIPVCMSNAPELVYVLGAASMLGAKLNIFSDEFDKDYIVQIIKECNSEVAFIEDNKFKNIGDLIGQTQIKHVVMPTLVDSITNGNPYQELDKVHGLMQDSVNECKENNSNILSIKEFIHKGNDYKGEIEEDCNLDDEFLITYTSGSTHSTRPKAIVHATRSLITIGRCHDPEVQKTTSMKDFTIMAHIPTHSNTDIISSISDALMQGSKLALEPIPDKDFFISALQINRPNYVVGSRSVWTHTMKKVLLDPKYANVKLPELLLAFVAGEPLAKGEEKLINKGLRKVNAGKKFTHLPISPITASVAGGDCEHGGIFWLLFRSLQSKKPGYMLKQEPHGMHPFEMVEVAVLDEEGKYCKPYQMGRLVANSPCNMKGYKNNPEATEKFFIKDYYGKTWGDCNVYSFIDENNAIYMKGRIPTTKEELPTFVVADSILKDTKNILSCEVVDVPVGDDTYYVAHIEMQPGKSGQKIYNSILSAENRCLNDLGEDVTSKVLYRLHSTEESYPLTGCGKRNVPALKKEGITDLCIKPVYQNGTIELKSAGEYLSTQATAHKQYTK